MLLFNIGILIKYAHALNNKSISNIIETNTRIHISFVVLILNLSKGILICALVLVQLRVSNCICH